MLPFIKGSRVWLDTELEVPGARLRKITAVAYSDVFPSGIGYELDGPENRRGIEAAPHTTGFVDASRVI